MRKIIGLVFLSLFCVAQANAQVSDSATVTGKPVSQISGPQLTISGKVTDSQGEPLPGATIVMKGNVQVNCVTNDVGNFQLTVPKGATIVISFVGMVQKSSTLWQSANCGRERKPKPEGCSIWCVDVTTLMLTFPPCSMLQKVLPTSTCRKCSTNGAESSSPRAAAEWT